MAKKHQGLKISIITGVVVVALLMLALLLQLMEPAASTDTDSTAHTTTPATDPHDSETSQSTYAMPDGSTMNAEEMSSHGGEAVGGAEAAGVEQHAASEGGATSEESAHVSSGGTIDWQMITLILALIGAFIAVATTINEHLRRRIRAGARAATEASNG